MHVIEAPNATQVGMIEAVVSWCECLQGRQPIRQALRLLANSLSADSIVLSRVSLSPGGRSFIVTASGNSRQTVQAVPGAFAPVVLGEYLSKAKSGSVWYARGNDTCDDSPLRRFQLAGRLAELVVVPLSIDKSTADFVELHFGMEPSREQQAALTMLGASLAQTWANRAPGTFARTMRMARPEQVRDITDVAPILSVENPARLSRSEYRLCVLLNRGLGTSDVRETLGITEATLRTHLRNIYAKTDSNGMAQLLYKLVSSHAMSAAG